MGIKEYIHRDGMSVVSTSINKAVNRTFTCTIPPHTTHSLFISQNDFFKRVNVYPSELPGIESEDVNRAYYDLGAETVNYWLLNEACNLVLSDLFPGVSHGLKSLSAIYHLDMNSGYKELEKMGRGTDPKNLKSVINKSLFSHDPGELTQYWNTHNDKKIKTPDRLTTKDFILDIGRLACPATDIKKIQSKMQQPTPNWVGDFEAVTTKEGETIKPEWLNLVALTELVGGAVMLSTQPIPAAMLLGSSFVNAGLSILDEIYKNIYMRSLSETDFGIRKIKWENNYEQRG